MGNWVNLAERINLFEDFVAFGGVCRPWRLVAVKENFNGSLQIPWIMLSEEDNIHDHNELRFVSLTKGATRST